jgi:hypothetical protein
VSFRLRLVRLLRLLLKGNTKEETSHHPKAKDMQAIETISGQYACITRPEYARPRPPKKAICYRCSLERTCETHHSFIHPWLTFTLCTTCHQLTDEYTEKLLIQYQLTRKINSYDHVHTAPPPTSDTKYPQQPLPSTAEQPYQQTLFTNTSASKIK